MTAPLMQGRLHGRGRLALSPHLPAIARLLPIACSRQQPAGDDIVTPAGSTLPKDVQQAAEQPVAAALQAVAAEARQPMPAAPAAPDCSVGGVVSPSAQLLASDASQEFLEAARAAPLQGASGDSDAGTSTSNSAQQPGAARAAASPQSEEAPPAGTPQPLLQRLWGVLLALIGPLVSAAGGMQLRACAHTLWWPLPSCMGLGRCPMPCNCIGECCHLVLSMKGAVSQNTMCPASQP
jgi:hypothetical protein